MTNKLERVRGCVEEALDLPNARVAAERAACGFIKLGCKLPSSEELLRIMSDLKNDEGRDPYSELDDVSYQAWHVITEGLCCLAMIALAHERM